MDFRHPFKNEPVWSAITIAGVTAVGARFGFNVDPDLILNVMGAAAIPTAVALRSNVAPAHKVTPEPVLKYACFVCQRTFDTQVELNNHQNSDHAQDVQVQTNTPFDPEKFDPLGRPLDSSPELTRIDPGTVDRPI